MENGPVSQQQADILDAWRSGQFNLWAQLEPLVEAAITKRFVACASAPPTEKEWAQIEPLVNAVITRRLIAFHAAILRGNEIPELRRAEGLRGQLEQAGVLGRGIEEKQVECSEEVLKEAFHAAVRGGELPELKPAKADCSEDTLKEEALKRLVETAWFAMGRK